MPRTLPPDLARGLLARGQRLAGAPRSSVVDMVRAVAALQAQDAAAAAHLGIRARRPGSTLAEVEAARFEERSVARTWVMRGTLHLIPAEDARWMVALLGPVGLKQERAADRGAGGRRRAPRTSGRRWPTARSPAASSPTPCGRAASASRITRRCRPGSPASPRSRARSSRGRASEFVADRRLARAAPGRRRRTRWSSSPAATRRPPAVGARGLRGLVGAGDARGAPRLRGARARGGRGARPPRRGSRAGSSRRRRTCGCCRCSTRACSATATAR